MPRRANSSHVRLAKVGERLIDRHGRDVELVTYSDVGDDWDPARSEGAVTPAVAVFVNPRNAEHESEENAALISDDVQIVFIRAATEVQKDMRIRETVDGKEGKEYSITLVLNSWPGVINVINRVVVKL